MSKVADYLQEHLTGEVMTSPEIRRRLAHDGSVLRVIPAMAAYPADESDVRKIARFCWQLAERGRPLPMTVRGGGSDTSGAAIGSGVVIMMTAHMNRILALEPKKKQVVVEPGMTYDKLQQTLFTHGFFLPPAPASAHYATVGGGLGNNVVGSNSVKYGGTLKYVQSLRVVLANGEIIETGPLSKRELSRKMGLSTFEGHVYRALDGLLEENGQTIAALQANIKAAHNGVGYNLAPVKAKDHFDLTPLFVGSQGTLGIITEATLSLEPHNPETVLALISLDSIDNLVAILPSILSLKPSMVDVVSDEALQAVAKINPRQLSAVMDVKGASLHLFVEFDDLKPSTRTKNLKALSKLVHQVGGYCLEAKDYEAQARIWKIQRSVSTLLLEAEGQRKAVPMAEDVAVPTDGLGNFLKEAASVLKADNLPFIVWGHAGSGILRFYPQLDLAEVGDRQRFFKLSETLYKTAAQLGGVPGAAGDGRIRAPYVHSLYGDQLHGLIVQVKSIFDPLNILNPGVKTATAEDNLELLRTEYSLSHRHEHLPRS